MSRVIHRLDRVRPSTRQRVLDVIDALGFIPDGAAQSLARHRKEVIGLVGFKCPGPGTDVEQDGMLFLDEVMRGVEGSLSEIGWSLLISVLPRGGDAADAAERLQKISAKVDGLIIAEGVVVGSRQLRLLAGRIPIALVAGRPGEAHADVIHADNRAGTSALVRHLVEQHGRTRLFYVSGPLEAPDAQERRAAFAEALAAYPGRGRPGPAKACSPRSAGSSPCGRSWPGRLVTGPTPLSAPMTRWPSGPFASCRPPGCASRPTSPWSASTTSRSARCSTCR